MRIRISPFLVGLAVAAVSLAGCTSSPSAHLEVRATPQDSQLWLAVDDVASDMEYADLLILVDNVPWTFGAAADPLDHRYSVDDKDQSSDQIRIGDLIRVPIAGSHDVELRHQDGGSMQQIQVNIPDNTAPGAPTATAPVAGASGISRQPVLQWTSVQDASGVSYELEYWISQQQANAVHNRVSGLLGTTHAITPDESLLPATSYRWHVRAVDGMGNSGVWSAEQVFTTAT